MVQNSEINRAFRERLLRRDAMLVPGAANALSARLIEDMGYEALYLTGAGLTNTFYGMPDLAFVGLQDLAAHTAAIRNVVDLPIIVDADTGFGNAVNTTHTVRVLEAAGASAIQIEDQVSPKRCGHFNGKDVIPLEEMLSKVKAAVDARRDGNLQIMARTDARATLGFEAAMERAEAFVEAGADITFVEAPIDLDEIAAIPRRLACPQLINIVVGGKTPAVTTRDLAGFGFSIVLYANATLQGATYGMRAVLEQLARDGILDETGPVASFRDRQALVRKDRYDALEERYRT